MITVPTPSRRGIALMALSGLNAVALLAVSLWLITRASEQPPIMYLQMAIVGVRAFALGRAFFRYVGRLQSHDHAMSALADLRVSFVEQLVSRGPRKLIVRERGALVSSIVRDVDSLQDHALRFVEPLWVSGVVIVTTVAAIFTISIESGLIVTAACGISVTLLAIIDAFTARHAARSLATLKAEMHAVVTERVRFDAVLRAFGAAEQYQAKLLAIESRIAAATARPAWVSASATAIATALTGAATLAIISTIRFDGAPLHESVPPIVATVALVSLALVEFLVAVPSMFEARRSTTVAHERLVALSNGESERSTGSDVVLEDVTAIQVRDLGVVFEDSSNPVFHPITFTAQRGDVVLVRGESGSGKSTLAAVLAGLIPASQGSYRLNNIDSLEISPADLRRNVGLCEQHPHLFAETIRHNLDFANPDSTDDDLWGVLRRVGLDEWARSRKGLETFLGEAGGLVSGGQAQRLSLARVLLAGRDVIVLDEPAANLEPRLAELLLKDLLVATRDAIVVIASHTPVPIVRNTVEIFLD